MATKYTENPKEILLICTECGGVAEGNASWTDGSGEICNLCAANQESSPDPIHIFKPITFWESPFAYTGKALRKDEAQALGYMIGNWKIGRDPAVSDKLTKRQQRAIDGLIERGFVVRVVHDTYPIDTFRALVGETVFPCSLVEIKLSSLPPIATPKS